VRVLDDRVAVERRAVVHLKNGGELMRVNLKRKKFS
jgi:hypothetical protein